MHLFSLIADQVRNKQELFTMEGKIMDTLLSRGYQVMEADTALTLMQSLVNRQSEERFRDDAIPRPSGMRMMNTEERSRFTPEAFGFVTRLAQLDLVSFDERDMLIEKALSGTDERIDLERIRHITLLHLFSGVTGEDDGLGNIPRRLKRTAWN